MLTVEEILKLDIDCIIPLNTNVGDPIEIYANDVLIGYGEIVIINDDIGVKVVQIKKDAINTSQVNWFVNCHSYIVHLQ